MPPNLASTAFGTRANAMEALSQRVTALRKTLRQARQRRQPVSDFPSQQEDVIFAMDHLTVDDNFSDTSSCAQQLLVLPAELQTFHASTDGREVVSEVEEARTCAEASSLMVFASALASRLSPRWTCKLRTANPKGYASGQQNYSSDSYALTALPHTFVHASTDDGLEVIVDIAFRSHFEMPSCSADYKHWLNQVPEVLVAPPSALRDLVDLLAVRLALETASQGRSLPPWRSLPALMSKWCPHEYTDTVIKASSSLHQVSACASSAANGSDSALFLRLNNSTSGRDACVSGFLWPSRPATITTPYLYSSSEQRTDCSGDQASQPPSVVVGFAISDPCIWNRDLTDPASRTAKGGVLASPLSACASDMFSIGNSFEMDRIATGIPANGPVAGWLYMSPPPVTDYTPFAAPPTGKDTSDRDVLP